MIALHRLKVFLADSFAVDTPLGGEGESDATDSMVKSFLAREPRMRGVFVGLKSRIDAISKNKGVPESIRKSLMGTVSDKARLESQASVAPASEVSPALLEKLSAMEVKLKAAFEKADSTPVAVKY